MLCECVCYIFCIPFFGSFARLFCSPLYECCFVCLSFYVIHLLGMKLSSLIDVMNYRLIPSFTHYYVDSFYLLFPCPYCSISLFPYNFIFSFSSPSFFYLLHYAVPFLFFNSLFNYLITFNFLLFIISQVHSFFIFFVILFHKLLLFFSVSFNYSLSFLSLFFMYVFCIDIILIPHFFHSSYFHFHFFFILFSMSFLFPFLVCFLLPFYSISFQLHLFSFLQCTIKLSSFFFSFLYN